MKSFLKSVFASMLGFLLGIFVVILFFGILIAGIVSSGSGEVKVSDNTVLELKLSGDVPERLANNPFEAFGDPSGSGVAPAVGLDKIIRGLDRAKNDPKIKGILLRTDLYAGGLATADEIRTKILEFRKSGKFVYAYAEVMTDGGYFIASACDKIYLNPKGFIEFNGFAGRVAFYKGMLDKLGVEFEVFKAGKYKGAVEPFIQTSLSEPNKEQIKAYITQLFGYHIKTIAQSRKLDSAQLADVAHKFLARNAKTSVEYKLVDGLKYEDEVESEIRKKIGLKEDEKFKPMGFAAYTKSEDNEAYSKDKIAVIYATGEINMGKNESGDGIGSETIAASIRKARLDKSIKAVVLRVNSPGGSSNASDIIAREVELCKKVKPVIISFGDVAASGGYYIACGGDSIFAYPNTVTGSIGVFALIPNTSKLYKEKMGLAYETVPTGEFANGWRPDQPLSDGMRMYFQEMVQDIYGDFIQIVARGRKLDTATVAGLAEGHVYTAMQAKQLKLVDQYGGIQRAIQSAAWKAKLKEYRVVSLPTLKTPFEMLFGDNAAGEVAQQVLQAEMGDVYSTWKQVRKMEEWRGVQMRMPWTITVE
jgi:protease-4